MKSFLSILFLFIITTTFSQEDDLQYKSTFNGMNISSTPFGDYIKTGLPGTNIVMVVSYGCSHCWDATIAINKLKKENLVSSIIVLGTGTEEEKAEFKKETKTDYPMIDYDFDTLKTDIKIKDPGLAPPPFAILLEDGVIRAIFVEMPSVKEFKAVVSK